MVVVVITKRAQPNCAKIAYPVSLALIGRPFIVITLSYKARSQIVILLYDSEG